MPRTLRRPRSGFTLIELIIVMGIMALIAALAILFLPNLDRNRGVPNAVTQLEGWVRLSKNHALRDGAPRGVRFIVDPDGRVTSLQYIEQPEPLAPRGNGVRASLTTQLPPPYPDNLPRTVVTLGNIINGTPVLWDGVMPGDFFELTESPGGIYRIEAVAGATIVLHWSKVVDGTYPAPLGTPLVIADGFRVIRAPRPLVGEPMLQMNKDVYIDPTWCYPCPRFLGPVGSPAYGNTTTYYAPWSASDDPPPTNAHFDVLFNSSGQCAGAASGHLILAVRHVDRPNDMILVVIYSRTGRVAAVSVYDVAGADPYSFVRDGSASGL